ncbi:uncharacterized protein LOC125235435 [Leguminivora glycinivorella]|uniref:uncharacterized protein LOC125235435 n=1 Tax=Leguminivora glycinivorella TaxID=1035111 RepID=UPI0020109AE4|nr:uncharacterized protein LOC125235435 [Leguminivora glycinivorella]
MPPNATDPPIDGDPEIVYNGADKSNQAPQFLSTSKDDYKLNIFQSSLNQIAHILIGMTVGVMLLFTMRNGLPIGATPRHITLCVLGYHLLMTQAILSLSPHNSWSSRLTLVHRRRAHWILQILGSSLALAGCFIKILDKTVHWNTMHGQFALVSMVFTSVALVNGLASLYANELRGLRLSPNLSKLTHICFGIVGFSAASITLCYGLDKNMFRTWASDDFTTAMIVFVATYTAIIVINPFISFFKKGRGLFTN